MTKLNWREASPRGVLATLFDELRRGGRMPSSFADLERLGTPSDVVDAMTSIAAKHVLPEARVIRVWVAALAGRHADEIGHGEAMRLVGPSFDRDANQQLLGEVESLLTWRGSERS
jgi:hypothetical protein